MENVPLINCTPHDIHIYDITDKTKMTIVIPTSDFVARLSEETHEPCNHKLFWADTIPIPIKHPPKFQGVCGLPENDKCDVIVSMLVAQELARDCPYENIRRVYSPYTGSDGCIRDKTGCIVGTQYLVWWYG